MHHQLKHKTKSVKSIHPGKSVIQTSYDIIKVHGGGIESGNKGR